MSRSAPARVPGVATAAALSLGLALYLTFPVWLHPRQGVIGNWQHPDMISNHWLYRWVAEQLAQGGSLLHNDRYYLPVGDAPWLAGNGNDAVLAAPLLWLLGWPFGVTVWTLLTLTLNGVSGWAFCRASGADRHASLLGAVTLTLCTYTLGELGAGRLAQAPLYWSGFFLALWRQQLDDPTWRRGLLAGLCFGGAAFTYPYQGLWAAMMGLGLWTARPGLLAILRTAPTTALGCLPLGIFLSRWSSIPGTAEGTFPHPITVDSGLPWTWLFSSVPEPMQQGPVPLIVLVLVVAGLVKAPRTRWTWTLLGIAGVFFVLALGPELRTAGGELTGVPGPFAWFYGAAAPLRRFWWPYRQAWMVLLALLPIAATGLVWVRGELGLTPLRFATLLVALLVGESVVRGDSRGVPVSTWAPPLAYARLQDLPDGALLELPLATPWTRSQQSLSYQWVHGRALVNGHAMWVPRVRPDAWDAWVADNRFLHQLSELSLGRGGALLTVTAEDLAALADAGVRYISVNPEYYQGEFLALAPLHRTLLQTLFGDPVVSEGEFLKIHDLTRWTGLSAADPADWTVSTAPEAEALADLALRPDMALGWTTLPRLAMAQPAPGHDPGRPKDHPGSPAGLAEPDPYEGVPPAVRRTRERKERDRGPVPRGPPPPGGPPPKTPPAPDGGQ